MSHPDGTGAQEMALVGSLMWADEMQSDRFAQSKELTSGWALLSKPRHRVILQALGSALERSPSCDLVMLHSELSATGKLDEAGGADALTELIEGVPNVDRWKDYADGMVRLSHRRKAIEAATQILDKVKRGEELNGELEDVSLFSSDAAESAKADAKKHIPKTIEEVRQLGASLPKVEPTEPCFPEFSNQLSGGYRPGWVVIVGAFTGGGKTTVSVRETVHKAFLGNPTLYISCELAAVEVQQKIDMAATEDSSFKVPPLPIWIEDRFSALGDICKVIETWSAANSSGKTPVVVLDYLQRVRSGAQSNREREVAIVAEELQQLARRLGIILVCAAQLNRNSVSESNTGPQLHHLRESGLIEQIADVAFLINKTEVNRLKVFLAKNRWGPAGDEVEYAVDFPNCRMGPLSQMDKLEPIAERVVEFLEGCKEGKAKPREVSQAVKINGKHPNTAEILDAGRYSKKYGLKDGVLSLFGGAKS